MIEVRMPSPAEGLEEATIARWLKRDGEPVAIGDELLEIETDKVTFVHEAEQEGILQIVEPEGAAVAIGTVIARLAAATESPARAPASVAPAEPEERAPAVEQVAAEPVPEPDEAPASVAASASAARVRATPLARRIARTLGVDLSLIAGTGPSGLVTSTDVAGPAPAPAAAGGNGRAAVDGNRKATVEPLSRVQQVIARRMLEAKATVPEFQVQTEAAVDELLALRNRIKSLDGVTPPSVNDFVIKASALALREHPRVNGSYRQDGFVLHPYVNVGFAVAADDALIVPTIRDADRRSVLEIAAEARRLAERARSGTFAHEDVSDGTFTVSNLGMFGMTAISPILNVPQAAILGVGAPRTVAQLRDDGTLEAKQLLTLTLTCDHRILYGADAARFLSRVRTLLEEPLRLLLEEPA